MVRSFVVGRVKYVYLRPSEGWIMLLIVVAVQMYDVNSGKSYPAGYVSLSGHDNFTVSTPCSLPFIHPIGPQNLSARYYGRPA